ncbi:MAG: ATP-dependent DNA helicase [Candidatus Saccharimonadales bacterium]
MGIFEDEYGRLNEAQRQAVDSTEGPVLVIAGPGTGKTQLLSMRVANILRKNDVSPGNVLCLTFTDNAARNMRDRLSTIIGQSAYHVAIHTFHSFGADIINQYPDYFTDRQLLQQVDELGRYELLHDIFEGLPHSNPLSVKVGEDYIFLRDTLSTISWLKQNALSPDELREVITNNQQFIEATSKELAETFAATASPKLLPKYEKFLKSIQKQATGKRYFGFPEYATEAANELQKAIEETPADGRYAKPITAWRNAWCKKDGDGKYVYKDAGASLRKLQAVADAYEALLASMASKGLYDFDDMVVEAVHAMEDDDELRFNLQERYQYILVDEFQDTNKAQLRIISALGDNPVHENRPNIMAVGDDDQAIYAFQGAEVSNMVAFARQYREPELIALEENFRSNAQILELSSKVSAQIQDRLESTVPNATKQLTARKTYEVDELDHTNFASELAQYDWIASEIGSLLKKGMKPQEIAVIAPRHKYLERLMPYLGQQHIPVAYERRENILDAPIILQISTMAELIVAIADNRQDDVDSLFAEVLSYDFWGIDAETLVELSLSTYNSHKHWLETLTKHKDATITAIAAWFVELAKHSSLEPMEYVLDQLIGTTPDGVDSEYDDGVVPKAKVGTFVSPLRVYYFPPERYEQATDSYLTLLGQLSTLRQRLRQWQPDRTLQIKDYVEFVALHRSAKLKIVDSNPHTQTTNAVQVMTAYKAKGLEFEVVFVINAQDEVWGPTARSGSQRIALPLNLPIAPAGDSDDDKLRLFFVALTRAKHTLHITSYSHTLENKLSPALSFLMDGEDSIHTSVQPKTVDKPAPVEAQEILATDWAYRYRQIIADKPSLLEPILETYKLSVTHLNNFIDIRDGGPEYFLLHNLLRFPEAISQSAAYGDAMHKTLQWLGVGYRKDGGLPSTAKAQEFFSDALARTHLRPTDLKRLNTRGREALAVYLDKRSSEFSTTDLIERGFNNEGVVVAEARLSGKIDKLSFTDPGTAVVIDFKTGKPAGSWQGKDDFEKVKLHKYRQQLMFYKLLVEQSANFAKKVRVQSGALEFVEADSEGKLIDNLSIEFDDAELAHFTKLIGAVWQHIMDLNFPDTSAYPQNLKGIQQFEQDLIDGTM